ncbi:MAG TPA: phenylalanine--tRNA ligase beta subunit-related protein [Candidatus Heimdallarchaeota archaeon]|nr:phenylalanine--tRNA ligase beta subunit-related protein [Candidatus Heimdallarchaeota archaeon]
MTERAYVLELDPALHPSPVLPALIWAEGISSPRPTAEAPSFLIEILEQCKKTGEGFVTADLRARVRDTLRHGRYKPAGRGKPASEFLLRAALSDSFPLVNEPVDINNAISLASGLPGSIFDADLSGTHLLLRRGRPGESYVFNPAGQVIGLEDLIVVCRRQEESWVPCGNPVKDAMATKIRPETQNVAAILYAPTSESIAFVETWAGRYAELLSTHCRAQAVGFKTVTS